VRADGRGGSVGLGGSRQQQQERLGSMYDMGKLRGMPLLPASGHHARRHSELDATRPMRALLASHPSVMSQEAEGETSTTAAAEAQFEALSFSELRDRLLALGPLDVEWVKRVNAAEVGRSLGRSVGRSIGRSVGPLKSSTTLEEGRKDGRREGRDE
jgi:hypothetical protein